MSLEEKIQNILTEKQAQFQNQVSIQNGIAFYFMKNCSVLQNAIDKLDTLKIWYDLSYDPLEMLLTIQRHPNILAKDPESLNRSLKLKFVFEHNDSKTTMQIKIHTFHKEDLLVAEFDNKEILSQSEVDKIINQVTEKFEEVFLEEYEQHITKENFINTSPDWGQMVVDLFDELEKEITSWFK